MPKNLLSKLREINVNVDACLRRFMNNDSLYIKFLGKFLSDENYSKVTPSLTTGNIDDSIMAVHTLKGLAANLGMDQISTICQQMLTHLRAGNIDEAKKYIPDLDGEYEKIRTVIAQNM